MAIGACLLSVLALLAPLGWGQPANQPDLAPASFDDFSGGYVDSVDAARLEPKYSPRAQNVVIDNPYGSIKPRKGITQCGTLPSGNIATNLYEYSKGNGTRRLIATDNGIVYETADCVAWTTVKFGLDSARRVFFTTARDKLWMVNGSTHAFTWDSVTLSTMDARSGTPSPAPPKCQFLEFWKERVWCARTSDSPSSVAYSDVRDNNGNDVDPSTGSLAWPAVNVFQVDQDGGCPVYGIKAYRNRLFVHKDRCGVFEIIFNSNFDNAVVRTAAKTGSRFNSFVELDGMLYYTGFDGIYEFDGENARRISDGISNKVGSLAQNLVNTSYKLWTSQSDFGAGTHSRTNSTVQAGDVVISSDPASMQNGRFETGSISPHKCQTAGTGSQCEVQSEPGNVIEGTYSAQAFVNTNGGSVGVYVFDTNGSTRASLTGSAAVAASLATYTITTDSFQGASVFLHFFAVNGSSESHIYTASFTANGNITYQGFGRTTNSPGWDSIDNIKTYTYFSTGTYFSEIYNTVSVSSWSVLDAEYDPNGGALSFQYRCGTTNANAAAAAWSNITPGANLACTTDKTFVQWLSSFTAQSGNGDTPELHSVSINWTQGGSPAQATWLADWDNRLWVTASSATTTSTTTAQNNITLVKTRKPLDNWVPYDLYIGPMARYNDRFYAAASTHSAIYRLDYGTNDNGKPICWFWESRDEMWGAPYQRKDLLEISTAFRKDNASNSTIGFSRDSGATYTDATLDMSGSGVTSKRFNVTGGNSQAFRWRLQNCSIDETATFLGATMWARPWKIRE